MKNIMHINEFFRIYENNDQDLFLKERELKNFLLNDKNFIKGEVLYALSNLGNDKRFYDQKLRYASEFGLIPLFSVFFSTYDGQVCNGGHAQYFDNGYASSISKGAFETYRDIDKHNDFVRLFKELKLDKILPTGNKALDIILSFYFDPDDLPLSDCPECNGYGDIDCSECKGEGRVECTKCGGEGEIDDETCPYCDNGSIECDSCDGEGKVPCDECQGKGEVENNDSSRWEDLDDMWYKINDKFIKELEEYIKTLTLDDEKIADLIEIAKSLNKFNI